MSNGGMETISVNGKLDIKTFKPTDEFTIIQMDTRKGYISSSILNISRDNIPVLIAELTRINDKLLEIEKGNIPE